MLGVLMLGGTAWFALAGGELECRRQRGNDVACPEWHDRMLGKSGLVFKPSTTACDGTMQLVGVMSGASVRHHDDSDLKTKKNHTNQQ